jgi:diaminohydroxyphosphoribosylaminopyrimidine deaminase/5-amino-6-(5-phosphoribosylamino)uracil reductase
MHTSREKVSEINVRMMQRCIQLARLGIGRTGANPLVGCVIARNEELLAEGYHQRYGGPHAEVEAISKLSSEVDLNDATLYVNLEPCCYHGKTPPCTNAILNAGIRKVVMGCYDPNPKVAGGGASLLRAAGIEVISGVLEDQAIRLNDRFFVNQREGRPYVILKWAQTLDGFMDKLRAPGEKGQFKISGAAAANLVHRWRADCGAVMVGRMTAEIDDPLLNVRYVDGPQPVRIVWDSELRLHHELHLFSSDSKVIVLNDQKEEIIGNIIWLRTRSGENNMLYTMQKLYELGVHSILVEGGSETLHRFMDAGIWDDARVFTSAMILGDGLVAPKMKIAPAHSIRVGRDILQYFHASKSYISYG